MTEFKVGTICNVLFREQKEGILSLQLLVKAEILTVRALENSSIEYYVHYLDCFNTF